jgi:hydroxymethylpyrimidine/phosphomethylpyrimidine kinase
MIVNILSIGGSDPSSGAGIQSDIRAASALGANCFSVVTAVTFQNSAKFYGAEVASANSVKRQIESVFNDFVVDAINIGMVYDTKTIMAIHASLKNHNVPIILDPVLVSTTGGILLKKSAIIAFKRLLVPLAYAITPNIGEAEILAGIKVHSHKDAWLAAKKLVRMGAKNVIITGFAENDKISDFVYENEKQRVISGKRINVNSHGSGCNFAIALTYSIAKKKSILESAKFAKRFAQDAIRSAQTLGSGLKITNPKGDRLTYELGSAVSEFSRLDGVHSIIPECQTNFVFAKQNPKTVYDVIGVAGRIVRAGNKVFPAGTLEYGASKHVAAAVLVMQKKFPEVRSALNIRFDERLIKKVQKEFKVTSYDRRKEPQRLKQKENSSVSWGIREAIKNLSLPPDIIYHRGDFGKEPMILVFGKNPKDVIDKVASVL